jgi:hypothetical protein
MDEIKDKSGALWAYMTLNSLVLNPAMQLGDSEIIEDSPDRF